MPTTLSLTRDPQWVNCADLARGPEGCKRLVGLWRDARALYGVAVSTSFCSSLSCAARAQPCMTWK